VHFSSRTAWEFRRNTLTQMAAQRRNEGKPLCDWTVANPTLCGFAYDRGRIATALGGPAAFVYAPEPVGMFTAREAVARFLGEHGMPVSPERLLLTASSSEAYAYLFRLLCGPGDAILIPKPGYPLFDDLARLHDVEIVPYRSHYAGGWHLDEESVRRAITPATRAIVVVHPNNPTGTFLAPREQEALAAIAREHRLALIADEVFLTFPFAGPPHGASFAGVAAPLVFTLNGLSKAVGLPQMKLGWIAVHGEASPVREALQRLEMIADTFLSVNTPVQVGLPEILAAGIATGEAIRSRVAANYAGLSLALRGSPVSVLHAEAGWSAILRLPGTMSDEAWAVELLGREGLLVHPGHFFDLAFDAAVVVSLLPEERVVSAYAENLLAVVHGVQHRDRQP
jgi:aspartate/methionine/tyrosine aminotransferase